MVVTAPGATERNVAAFEDSTPIWPGNERLRDSAYSRIHTKNFRASMPRAVV